MADKDEDMAGDVPASIVPQPAGSPRPADPSMDENDDGHAGNPSDLQTTLQDQPAVAQHRQSAAGESVGSPPNEQQDASMQGLGALDAAELVGSEISLDTVGRLGYGQGIKGIDFNDADTANTLSVLAQLAQVDRLDLREEALAKILEPAQAAEIHSPAAANGHDADGEQAISTSILGPEIESETTKEGALADTLQHDDANGVEDKLVDRATEELVAPIDVESKPEEIAHPAPVPEATTSASMARVDSIEEGEEIGDSPRPESPGKEGQRRSSRSPAPSSTGTRGRYRDKGEVFKIYLGGLPDDTQYRDLEDCFGQFGEIDHIELKTGYAFIEFFGKEAADEAIETYNEGHFLGSLIKVEMSKSTTNQQKSIEDGSCFTCGERGHIAKNCPNDSRNSTRKPNRGDARNDDRRLVRRDRSPPPVRDRREPPRRDRDRDWERERERERERDFERDRQRGDRDRQRDSDRDQDGRRARSRSPLGRSVDTRRDIDEPWNRERSRDAMTTTHANGASAHPSAAGPSSTSNRESHDYRDMPPPHNHMHPARQPPLPASSIASANMPLPDLHADGRNPPTASDRWMDWSRPSGAPPPVRSQPVQPAPLPSMARGGIPPPFPPPGMLGGAGMPPLPAMPPFPIAGKPPFPPPIPPPGVRDLPAFPPSSALPLRPAEYSPYSMERLPSTTADRNGNGNGNSDAVHRPGQGSDAYQGSREPLPPASYPPFGERSFSPNDTTRLPHRPYADPAAQGGDKQYLPNRPPIPPSGSSFPPFPGPPPLDVYGRPLPLPLHGAPVPPPYHYQQQAPNRDAHQSSWQPPRDSPNQHYDPYAASQSLSRDQNPPASSNAPGYTPQYRYSS